MKQQEYEEAIDYFTIGRIFTEEEIEDMYEMRYRLAELIDKLPYWLELEERDKPMKPIEYDGQIPWVSYNCPNCLWTISSVMKESYCETCGQKIDWSG